MRHFITGGSGFVGSHLVEALCQQKQDVVVYDLVPLDPVYQKRSNVQYIQGDIRDVSALTSAMRGADIVHHNAAVLPLGRPGNELCEVNVEGTKKCLRQLSHRMFAK